MRNPKPQSEVVEYYREQVNDVATVGGYVRVCSGRFAKTCFGPKKHANELGWKVIEIDWNEKEFLLAPNDYRERMREDGLDREHHNAPKDGNDDPVFES